MDSLVEEGFVVLGGPLGDGRRALLVIEASDESMIERRLREDPWASMDLLRIGRSSPGPSGSTARIVCQESG